jgi:DNA modification methylase
MEEPTEIQEDSVPDVPEETITKLGDLWELGEHRLICGDSTDINVVDRLMDGVKADMVLSDPPYGMSLDTDFSTIKGSMKSLGRKNHTEGNKYEKVIGDNEDFKPELITTFFANFDYVKEMFLFGADYFAELLPDKNKGSWLVWDKRKESQADAIGSEFELIWSRNKHKRRMLRHDWFGFLSSENGADARNRVHPTQKPITLLVDILNQWGKDANVIVDLYGGSGSTLIACEQLNRKCYMCELDTHYVDVIIDRWEKFTGQKAVKLN